MHDVDVSGFSMYVEEYAETLRYATQKLKTTPASVIS